MPTLHRECLESATALSDNKTNKHLLEKGDVGMAKHFSKNTETSFIVIFSNHHFW